MESVELRPLGSGPDVAQPDRSSESDAGVPAANTDMSERDGPPTVAAAGFTGNDFGASPAPEPGCQKVDFLFVIDNSVSMRFAQNNLRNSFPGFMRVIRENVEAEDFHIMVVDTDSWDGNEDEQDANASAAADRCRDTLGAGRRTDAEGNDCGLPGSDRFASLSQPDLDRAFSCMASVGNSGDSDEQPMGALLAAISRAENDVGGCNEGFFRRDAILVVTIITNADDRATLGDPEDWSRLLLGEKADDQGALVVLGLVPDSDRSACNFFTTFAFSDSPRLSSFIGSLEHGALASVCEDDYAPFFEQAVQSIDTACEEFVPPVIQ